MVGWQNYSARSFYIREWQRKTHRVVNQDKQCTYAAITRTEWAGKIM